MLCADLVLQGLPSSNFTQSNVSQAAPAAPERVLPKEEPMTFGQTAPEPIDASKPQQPNGDASISEKASGLNNASDASCLVSAAATATAAPAKDEESLYREWVNTQVSRCCFRTEVEGVPWLQCDRLQQKHVCLQSCVAIFT